MGAGIGIVQVGDGRPPLRFIRVRAERFDQPFDLRLGFALLAEDAEPSRAGEGSCQAKEHQGKNQSRADHGGRSEAGCLLNNRAGRRYSDRDSLPLRQPVARWDGASSGMHGTARTGKKHRPRVLVTIATPHSDATDFVDCRFPAIFTSGCPTSRRHAMALVRTLCGLALAFAACTATAQDAPKAPPELDVLKKLVGDWDATMKFGGMESKGKVTYKMEVGGMWLVSNLESDLFGQKFHGKGL